MNSGILLFNTVKQKLYRFKNDARITVPFVASHIQEAVEIFVEICTDLAQQNNRVEEDIRVLRKDKVELPLLENDTAASYFKLPEDYFRSNRFYGICQHKDIVKDLKLSKVRANEENRILENSHHGPSFTWGRAPYALVAKGLKVYRGKEFSIVKIYCDYYKKPTPWKIASKDPQGKYVDVTDDLVEYDQECELNQNYQIRRISDITDVLVSRSLENNTNATNKIREIMFLENLFK